MISEFTCSRSRCSFPMTAAKISGKISPRKCIPIVTHLPFNQARCRRRNRQNRKTRTNRRNRWFASAYCSEPTAAFTKVSQPARAGIISIPFRLENFIESLSTTRNLTSASPADFKTTRTGSGQAPCRARKEFVIPIGPRLPVATAFMSFSIQMIATPFMRKVSKVKCTGSICAMASSAACDQSRLKARRAIGFIGTRR